MLVGLSIKGIAQYNHYRSDGFGCIPDLHTTWPDPYFMNAVSGLVGFAYTQTFLRRYFVEPLFGYGPYWTSTQGRRAITYLTWRSGVQINLGVRF